MPLFIDLRGYFVNNKSTVFGFLDYGILLKGGTNYSRGEMIDVGIGYRFFASSNIAMICSISGSFKGVSLTNEQYKTSDRTVFMKGLCISIGLFF